MLIGVSALPEDIQSVLNDLTATAAAAERLSTATTDAQFEWQPSGGRSWSIGQCLDHLAIVASLYTKAIRPAVDAARTGGSRRNGPLSPGPFGAWFIRSQEPPPRRRFRAPAKIGPHPTISRTDVMERYREAHRNLRRLVEDSALIDANATTFANPFVRAIRMRVATGLLVLASHERRHIWQAKRIPQSEGYPEV